MSTIKRALSFMLLVLGAVVAQYSQIDIDSGKVLRDLSKKAYDNAMKRLAERPSSAKCNKNNVKVYQEWWVLIVAKEKSIYTKMH
jgi:hypothetical protein